MEEKIAYEYYLLPDVEAVLLKIPWNLIRLKNHHGYPQSHSW